MEDEINDDVFDYDNGFSQCISGFGRSTLEAVVEVFERHGVNLKNDESADDEDATDAERIRWHVGELARWCRGLNGELKRAKVIADAAREYVEARRAERAYHQSRTASLWTTDQVAEVRPLEAAVGVAYAALEAAVGSSVVAPAEAK